MPHRPQPRPHRPHSAPSARRHLTPVPTPGDTTPRRKETYAEQQARLDAEAIDRWAVIVADMPPLSDDQIRALAVILNRIDARLAAERAADQDRAA